MSIPSKVRCNLLHGYMGQLLVADLTNRTTHNVALDESWSKLFLGGSGYASRLLYEVLDPTVDPFGPENQLLFMTGPLTGTLAPCTGRHVVCGKSPLTGIWGESNAGGHFGANLKFAGYDGVIVKGKSKSPVFIHIKDETVEIVSAEHLWGKTTDETQRILRADLGRVHVACIGPAGENLVRFAGIVNDERIAARCGLGAVMGSKKLKAVVVEGSGTVSLADADGFTELAREVSKTLAVLMKPLYDGGTATYVDIGMMYYDMPVKYFQEVEFDVESLNAAAMKDILSGRTACHSCPIACGRRVDVPEYNLKGVAGPEYQTIAAFGTNLLIPDLKVVTRMNRLCNQYGMDTISLGSVLAFSALLRDKGVLDDGLKWGDGDRAIDLVSNIANREGLGDELAEGSMRFAEKHNASELALHVRGLEIPFHDPRAFAGMATVYTVAARGASHMEGDMYTVDMGVDVREIGIVSGEPCDNQGKGVMAAKAQDYRAFFDCVIMCHFALIPTESIVGLLNRALGTSTGVADILSIGSRAVTMKRLFNIGCGLSPQDEKLPRSLLIPQPDEVTDDFVPDVDSQLNEYYEYRQWDRKTGRPTKDALEALGLTAHAQEQHQS